MVDFSLGYDVSGEHYGLGVGLSKPPDCFTVREHLENGTYTETDYVPKRTCRVLFEDECPVCSECQQDIDPLWVACPYCGAEVIE